MNGSAKIQFPPSPHDPILPAAPPLFLPAGNARWSPKPTSQHSGFYRRSCRGATDGSLISTFHKGIFKWPFLRVFGFESTPNNIWIHQGNLTVPSPYTTILDHHHKPSSPPRQIPVINFTINIHSPHHQYQTTFIFSLSSITITNTTLRIDNTKHTPNGIRTHKEKQNARLPLRPPPPPLRPSGPGMDGHAGLCRVGNMVHHNTPLADRQALRQRVPAPRRRRQREEESRVSGGRRC